MEQFILLTLASSNVIILACDLVLAYIRGK